jgi:hypothetical protein
MLIGTSSFAAVRVETMNTQALVLFDRDGHANESPAMLLKQVVPIG